MAGWRLLARFLSLCGFSLAASSDAPVGNTHAPPGDAPAAINDVERLSRFVTLNDQYNATKNLINFRAFLPGRADNELSISRTEALTEAEVWALGDEVVAGPGGRTIFARGDFHQPDVHERRVDSWQLRVDADEPPRRHAVIVGWPPSDQTEARKRLAQELRALAAPCGRPR